MERIKEAVERAKASRDKLDGRPRSSQQEPRQAATAAAAAHLAVPAAAEVQLNLRHLEAMRIVSFDGRNPSSASFDILRTQVTRLMSENGWQTLGVTSPNPACGKTVCAVNLAFSIARQPESSVTLVDMDLRKPQIANYLGLSPRSDISDLIDGNAHLSDVLVAPDLARGRLKVAANRKAVAHPSERMVSKEVVGLVSGLRSQSRTEIVVFDLPPMLTSDDVLAFLPQLDCMLLVVAAGQTTVSEAQECERQLTGSQLLGIVLNKADEAGGGTYY